MISATEIASCFPDKLGCRTQKASSPMLKTSRRLLTDQLLLRGAEAAAGDECRRCCFQPVSTCLQVCCTNLRLFPNKSSIWTLNPLRLICQLCSVLKATSWQQKDDLSYFPPKKQGHPVLWPSKSSLWHQSFQGYPLGPFSHQSWCGDSCFCGQRLSVAAGEENKGLGPTSAHGNELATSAPRRCLCKTPMLGCGQGRVVFKTLWLFINITGNSCWTVKNKLSTCAVKVAEQARLWHIARQGEDVLGVGGRFVCLTQQLNEFFS